MIMMIRLENYSKDRMMPLVLEHIRVLLRMVLYSRISLKIIACAKPPGGLVKCVLMLSHSCVAPNVHFYSLNPHLDLNGYPCQISATCFRSSDISTVSALDGRHMGASQTWNPTNPFIWHSHPKKIDMLGDL